MTRFTPQPAKERALQQLGVEAVGLGPPMLPRHGNAHRVDEMSLDLAVAEPAGQPEAIPPSLEGDDDPPDRPSRPDRLVSPTMQDTEKCRLVRLYLFSRAALDARHDAGHEPARLAHLDDRDQRALVIEGDARSAQVIRLRHGALHR